MTEAKVQFHPAAVGEAQAAEEWYAGRSLPAAKAFLEELEHALGQVREAPERWPRFKAGTRRYVFPRFPFSLVYRTQAGYIQVVAIAHHRRKPGYWQSR